MRPAILDVAEWARCVGVVGTVEPGFEDALVVVSPDGRARLYLDADDAAAAAVALVAATPDGEGHVDIDVPQRMAATLQAALTAAGHPVDLMDSAPILH